MHIYIETYIQIYIGILNLNEGMFLSEEVIKSSRGGGVGL